MKKDKIIFILGPTASGKSQVALALARKLKNASIISCDSMHVYRGMDIGTAKPTKNEQQSVPHYLIDLVSPRSRFSVFDYRKHALKTLRAVWAQKRIPIVAGGTGLYAKSVIDGLTSPPGAHVELRKKFDLMARSKGVQFLYKRLKKIDPQAALKIHQNDKKRIIRALEIWELSKRAKSDWESETKGLDFNQVDCKIFGLNWDRPALYERVEKRVDQMFQDGWVDEVKRLKKKGLSKTAKMAIGYREILDFLEGNLTFEQAIFETKKRTRHLVKKQMTWFRSDSRIQWIRIEKSSFVKPTVTGILNHLSVT